MTNYDNYNEQIISKFGDDYIINGDEFRYKCPFCLKRRGKADNDAKLYVNSKIGLFHCFKCGAKGTVGYKKQIKSSYGVYDDIIKYYNGSEIENISEDENMFYIPDIRVDSGTIAFDYCISRGISSDLIEYYDIRLGKDDLFGRIVIPNEIYGDRGIWTDMYSSRTFINQMPKYKNPKGVNKNNIVFNLHRIKEGVDNLYGVEGVLTSISAGKDSIAFYGCSPSDEQIQMVAKKNPKNFYSVLDNDEAGRKNILLLADKMSKLITGNVYVVYMPQGKDANDMGEQVFKEYCYKNRIVYQSSAYNEILEYFRKEEKNNGHYEC